MLSYIKLYIRKFYLNRKIYIFKNKKRLFSIRKFGGSTSGRAENIYISEPDTIDWINSFKKNSIFLDVGANIGIYSLYAASVCQARVVSLEPESHNFFMLNLNIIDNSLQKIIKAYPVAAHNKFEINNLYLSNIKFGGSGHNFGESLDQNKKKFKNVHVQGSVALTIDDFLSKIKFKPNYIKIDVDGNEDKVVGGMKKTLKLKTLKSVLIEINAKKSAHLKIFNIFKKNKFKLKNKKELISGQNFIFSREL